MCRQSGGAFDHEFTHTPLAKHASFSGSLVAEVSSLLHLKRLFDVSVKTITCADIEFLLTKIEYEVNLGLPTLYFCKCLVHLFEFAYFPITLVLPAA